MCVGGWGGGRGNIIALYIVHVHIVYMNNHVHRAPFSDIEERKK